MNHIMQLKKIIERHKAETVRERKQVKLQYSKRHIQAYYYGTSLSYYYQNEFCCLLGQASY